MLVKGATDISWFEWNTPAGLISGFIFVYSNMFFLYGLLNPIS